MMFDERVAKLIAESWKSFEKQARKVKIQIKKSRAFIFSMVICFSAASTEIRAACLLKDSIYKDQKGETARISNIKECFGWYNRDDETLSADGTCYLAEYAQKIAAEQSEKYNTRLVGERIFYFEYKNHTYVIDESVSIGVPWLQYLVLETSNAPDVSRFIQNDDVESLISDNDVLDFTIDSLGSQEGAKNSYQNLFGLVFKREKCAAENNNTTNTNSKNYNFCYKDQAPNHILDDPTYCLAYVEEYGERTGILKGDAKKGSENLRTLFPVLSEQCNSEWTISSEEKSKRGKETAKLNLVMILNRSVSADNFKDNIDHCLRTISFYGDVIKKMNKQQ